MRFALAALWLCGCAPPTRPSGTFEPPYALDVGALRGLPAGQAFITELVTGEFDGDGLGDVAIAWADGVTTISRFADSSLGLPEPLDGENLAPLLAAPLRGGVRAELLTTTTDDRVKLFEWSDERPGLVTTASVQAGARPVQLAWSDALSVASSELLERFRRVDSQSAALTPLDTVRPQSAVRDALAFDFDGDGVAEVVTLQPAVPQLELFRAGGGPLRLPTAERPTAFAAAGGGLFVASQTSELQRFVWTDGTLVAAEPLPVSGCTQVIAADLDGDGVTDVAALCAGVVEVLRNTGSEFVSLNRLPVDGARLLRRGDVTGDGLADLLLVPQNGSGTLFVARARAAR